jgi:hypothetical protein
LRPHAGLADPLFTVTGAGKVLELGVGEEQIIRGLPEKYRRRIRE